MTLLAVAALLPLNGCNRTPSEAEQDLATKGSANGPTTRAAALPKNPTSLDDYRKLAEAGDVGAMMLLARSHESMGTSAGKEEARKWYTKAAAAGNADAQAALKNLEVNEIVGASPGAPATPAAPTSPPSSSNDVASSFSLSPGISSQELRDAATSGQAPGGNAAAAASSPPPATAPAVAGASPTTRKAVDPNKVSWTEIVTGIDSRDFVTVARPNYKGKFVALTTAPDKTFTVAATGLTEDDLVQVNIVMRVRNRQDVAGVLRVQQSAQIARQITRDNVNAEEFSNWITEYLKTGQKSQPVFRNGWGIMITGTAAEKIGDAHRDLGEAVVIEMKK